MATPGGLARIELKDADALGLDPDAAVVLVDRGFDDVVFTTLDDAVAAAQEWLRANPSG